MINYFYFKTVKRLERIVSLKDIKMLNDLISIQSSSISQKCCVPHMKADKKEADYLSVEYVGKKISVGGKTSFC